MENLHLKNLDMSKILKKLKLMMIILMKKMMMTLNMMTKTTHGNGLKKTKKNL